MPTARRATVEVGVKVDQEKINQFNKALDRMVKSGGNVQKTMNKMTNQLKEFKNHSELFSKQYEKTFGRVTESNKRALKSNREFYNNSVSGQKRLRKSLKETESVDNQTTNTANRNHKKRINQNNSLIKSHKTLQGRIQKLNSSGDKLIGTGRSMSMASLGLGAAFLKGAKDASKLGQQYVTIGNLAKFGGEKEAEAQRNVNKMRKQGEKLSNQYGVSQSKIADGYETLTRRGYTTNQSLATQKTFLEGALASGDDYNDVVKNATSTLEQFGLKTDSTSGMIKNSKRVVNELAYGADLTATDFNKIGESMKYVGATAKSTNQSLSMTTSALGVLSNNGQEGSISGTGLRKVLNAFGSPNMGKMSQQAPIMDKLGLSPKSFRQANGKLKNIADLMDMIQNKTKNMGKAERFDVFRRFFGTTGQETGLLLAQNTKQIRNLNKEVANSEKMGHGKGYIAELSAHNLKSSQAQFKRFQEALKNLNMSFSNEILPNVTKVVKGLDNMIIKVADAPKWFKQFVSYGAIFIAGIAPVTLVLGSIKKAFGGVLTSIEWLRKQFNTPLSNRMTGSAVAQSEAMQGAYSGIGQNPTTTRSSRYQEQASNVYTTRAGKSVGRTAKFRSRFGGIKSTGTKLGKVGNLDTVAGSARNISKLASVAGKGLGAISLLTSATDLIGMNKKNSGKKIGGATGSAGGALAGGAIGSFIAPGVGTAIGSGLGSMIGSSIGKKIGPSIQKHLPKNTFKPITKLWNKSTKWLSKSFKSITKPFKGISKSFSKSFKPVSKSWNKLQKSLNTKKAQKSLKSLSKVAKFIEKPIIISFKGIGAAFKVAMSLIKGTAKGIASFLKGTFKGAFKSISGIFDLAGDVLSGKWKNIFKDLGKIGSGFVSIIEAPFKAVASFINSIFGDIKKEFNKYVSKAGNFVKHPINSIKSWAGFAKGGPINKNQTALVNEVGPESAYNPKKGTFRMLGNGTPTLTKLFSGEHVLTAKDTQKLINGNSDVHLKGYSKGTTKLGNPKSKLHVSTKVIGSFSSSSIRKMKKQLSFTPKIKFKVTNKDVLKDLIPTKTLRSFKHSINSISSQLTSLRKSNSRVWKNISNNQLDSLNEINRHGTKKIKQLKNSLNNTLSDIGDGWSKSWTSIANKFNSIFGKLDKYAHSGMKGAIKQLNNGIGGIDKSLSQFGGKSDTIKPIHYATGMQNANQDHIAMVNDDATQRQEAIVSKNGNIRMPQGKNVLTQIRKGDSVLNGSDTLKAKQLGLLPRYKKGKNSNSALKKLIENNNKNSNDAYKNDFTNKISINGSDLQKALIGTNAKGMNQAGKPFYKEAWNQLNGALSGGYGSGTWLHGPNGLSKTSGFGYRGGGSGGQAMHDGNDYSGPIGSRISAVNEAKVVRVGNPPSGWGPVGHSIVTENGSKMFTIYQEYGTAKNVKVKKGDIVHAGQTIATLGRNNVGTAPHVHIGVSKNYPFDNSGSTTSGWLDLTKMKSSKKKDKKDSKLSKLVSKKLKSQISWVSKNLSEDDFSAAGGTIPSSKHKGLFAKAGVPKSWYNAMNTIIQQESSWNPHARNGQYYGLAQTSASNYAKAGSDWGSNAITQIKGMVKYITGRYGNANSALSFRNKHNWYANGGWADKPGIFGEVKGQPEVAINPKRNTADNLIGEAITARVKENKQSPFAKLLESRKASKERKSLKTRMNQVMSKSGKVAQAPQFVFNNTFNISGNADKDMAKQIAQEINRQVKQKVEATLNQNVLNTADSLGIDL